MNDINKEALNILISILASIKSGGEKITPEIIDGRIEEVTSAMDRYSGVDKS